MSALSCCALIAVFAAPLVAQAQEITLEAQKRILGPPLAPSVGSDAPSVSVVEYFDYSCPTCRGMVPILRQLLVDDPGVALVYKDWPILGPVSVYAARCALAAKWQDKYSQAHDALIGGPRLLQTSQVDALLQAAGIDMTRLRMDLDRHSGTIDALLEHNDEEARSLNLMGTPGILVGRRLIPGGVDLATLKMTVANARKP